MIKAFAYSDGKWIARHDADDISLRNRFEILHGTISNTNGLNFVHSQAILIDKGATAIYPRSLFQYDTSLTSLIFGNFIVHGSIAIRREVLEDCGYDEKVSVAQDYDLYCRLKKKLIKAHLVPVPLYLLRRGTDSISSRRAHDQSVSVKTACRDTFSTCFFLIKFDTRTFNRTLLKLLRASFLIYKLALKKTSGKLYR